MNLGTLLKRTLALQFSLYNKLLVCYSVLKKNEQIQFIMKAICNVFEKPRPLLTKGVAFPLRNA